MKRYNKPVVEINGFEVEDIIAVSTSAFAGDTDDKSAYEDFLANSAGATDQEEALVFEW